MILSMIIFLPTIIYAEGERAKLRAMMEAEDDPNEKVHVIKLDDILKGKHSETEKKKEKIKKVNVIKKTPRDTSFTLKPVKRTPVSRKKEQPRATRKPSVKPSVPKKKTTSKNPVPIQPTRQEILDIQKAYANLFPEDKLIKKTPQQAIKTKEKVITKKIVPPTRTTAQTGWLYLGKFVQDKWEQQNNQILGLKNGLPRANHNYTIKAGSNLRQGYPSKKGMPRVVKVLPKGSKVRLLTVHNSGKSGHFWGKVQWF